MTTQGSMTSAERADRLMTVAGGWGALALGILGVHRWVAEGRMDWWSRAGLILSFGLAVMWIWGYWPQIKDGLRAWARSGGPNTAAVSVGLVLVLVLVNVGVRRAVVLKFDLTKNKRFTLSPRSAELLKSLKSPVRATVFIPAGGSTARMRDLFKQYSDASPNFAWTRVDPLVDQKTLLEKQPKLSPTDFTGAILEYNGKRQDVSEFTEKEVTSAILKMTRETQRKILFLSGHGESEVTPGGANAAKSVQEVVNDLKSLEWPVENVNLYGNKAPSLDPAEVAVLVVVGPEREFAPDEQKRIEEYLNKGGRLLLLLDPKGPSFSKFLAGWGIKTGNDVVLDRSQQGLVVVQVDRSAHESVRSARRVLFQPLRSVTTVTPAPSGISVTELLKSGPFSEVVSNYQAGKPVDLGSAKPGPVGLAALAEKSLGSGTDEKKARMIVVGDSTFMADQLTRLPTFYNLALASGLVNYLGEEDALVAIPPKDENTEQAFLTPGQGPLLQLIHFWDFPLLALVLAIVVYLKRR